LTAVGLAFLGLTVQTGSTDTHSSYSISAMIGFEGGMILLGTLLVLSHRVERIRHRHGVLLGAAAGILFGVSDVSIKALTGTVPGDFLAIVSPWTAVAVVASIAAFFASARALQVGEGVSTIAITTVSANVSAIIGGIVVFGDPLGDDAFAIVARACAFTLVIAAAALTPAPMRAASRTA
jgi:hypothetical protein